MIISLTNLLLFPCIYNNVNTANPNTISNKAKMLITSAAVAKPEVEVPPVLLATVLTSDT